MVFVLAASRQRCRLWPIRTLKLLQTPPLAEDAAAQVILGLWRQSAGNDTRKWFRTEAVKAAETNVKTWRNGLHIRLGPLQSVSQSVS